MLIGATRRNIKGWLKENKLCACEDCVMALVKLSRDFQHFKKIAEASKKYIKAHDDVTVLFNSKTGQKDYLKTKKTLIEAISKATQEGSC